MLLIALLAFAVPQPEADDPLLPALAGLLECSRPDDAKKTCHSIAVYKLVEGSTYANSSTIRLTPNGPLTLTITAPVTVKDGSVCGAMKAEYVTSGKISVDDTPMADAKAAPILARIATTMSALIGKEICVAYQSTPDGLIEKASVDGVYHPRLDQLVEWVEPDAGYVVAP